jgi:hypothetical protein
MMSEIKWMVELWRQDKPALFLHGESAETIATAIIEADDYYGEFGTAERMAKCWTPNALLANTYSEAGAKQTAKALNRCCGGVAVAVDHMFIDETPN